jgi:hypothetical protein
MSVLANRGAWKDWGKSGQPMRERVSGLDRWEICPHALTFPKKSQLVDAVIFLSFFFGAKLILWVGFFWGVFNSLKKSFLFG